MTNRRHSRHFAPERRHHRSMPVVLPMIAAVIAVSSWIHNYVATAGSNFITEASQEASGSQSAAAPAYGVTGDGAYFIHWTWEQGPMSEFTVFLITERH